MAGMETLVIHSQSYLVRWVRVSAGHTISWSLQPQKKSINFGIFKHPGGANGALPSLPTSPAYFEQQAGETAHGDGGSRIPLNRRRSSATNTGEQSSTVKEKLERLGIKQVYWAGRCDSDQVSMGKYDVPAGESGMYGLVFDNTISKSFSKTVTFVVMTFPTETPPKSAHHPRFPAPLSRKTSGSTSVSSKTSPAIHPVNDSTESLPQLHNAPKLNLAPPPVHGQAGDSSTSLGSSFYTGVLNKKRRKKAQGWARRFFSLDFSTSTLSYYKNSKSSALRGAIPLSLAVIGADREARQLSIDSGAEVWHLRALNQKDFEGWHDVLQKAAQNAAIGAHTPAHNGHSRSMSFRRPIQDQDWEVVESLVGRLSGITDAARRLTKDTDPKYFRDQDSVSSPVDTQTPSIAEESAGSRRAFWKRTNSSSGQSPNRMSFRRSVSAAQTRRIATPTLSIPSSNMADRRPRSSTVSIGGLTPHEEDETHQRALEILRDLDSVVGQFSTLIAEKRQRLSTEAQAVARRESLESVRSQEFFDAEEALAGSPQIVDISVDRDSEGGATPYRETIESETDSTSEPEEVFDRAPRGGHAAVFPAQPKTLSPLPASSIQRRTTIPPSSGPPPSLISFLRKNVGKDLSTIAMPVTANEPLSLLERQAESLEYSNLLDTAAAPTLDPTERLLHIAAFAISPLSANRIKERAIRKPFNPMLGETYELVREDRGFRFVAEKISHRPVRVACQAESKHWTFLHAPLPTQKFWGKSAELITEGRARVLLHATGDVYSWTPATCFLRNIIAGEKYVEPTSTMTILSESTGHKAVCTFKAGGMFSGRSEEVTVQVFDASGHTSPLGMQGKWTESLALDNGKTVWTVADLVHNAPTHYGMTAFAATLNEITALEKSALPPTDSRLRPDQRAYEDGNIDKAEGLKVTLEEGQRKRRKAMEERGEAWAPMWFERVGAGEAGKEGEEVWRLKDSAAGGYWAERQAVVERKKNWDVTEVFQT